MNPENQNISESKIIQLIIKLALIAILVVWCAWLILPFISLILWGAILAITLYPLYNKLLNWTKGRKKITILILYGTAFLIMVIPTIWMIATAINEIKELILAFQNSTFSIPAPIESVANWPLIGTPIYEFWNEAHTNLQALLLKHKELLSKIGQKFISLMFSFTYNAVIFIGAFLLSAYLLAKSASSNSGAQIIAERILGHRGTEFLQVITQTIRNVSKGIIGVALILFLLMGAAFMLAGIPFAALWAFLVFLLAIIQIPIALVTLPIIIYLFATREPIEAILWTVLILIVGMSDNILRPLVMGKGASVPIGVIIIGTLGGFILSGLIGLFTGAIVLSMGYKLVELWMHQHKLEPSEEFLK